MMKPKITGLINPLKHQRFPGVVPVLPGIEFQQEFCDYQASEQTHKVRNDSQEKQHKHCGDHAWRH